MNQETYQKWQNKFMLCAVFPKQQMLRSYDFTEQKFCNNFVLDYRSDALVELDLFNRLRMNEILVTANQKSHKSLDRYEQDAFCP